MIPEASPFAPAPGLAPNANRLHFPPPSMTAPRALEYLARLLLGGWFLFAGIQKALDPIQFLFDIRSFQLLPDPYAALLSLALPWLEIFCALGVLTKRLYLGSLALTALSLLLFIAAIAWSWQRGLDVSCGCFGKTDFALGYPQHLALNAALLALSLALFRRETRSSPAPQADLTAPTSPR